MAEQGIPVIGPFLNKIIGTRNERFVRRYTARVDAISAQEPEIRRLTDTELRGKLDEFRARVKGGEKPDELTVDVFAVAREAMDRSVGIRNIFNPESGFDPSVLPDRARALYDETRAAMEQLAPIVPGTVQSAPPENGVPDESNGYMGCLDPIAGWQQADIPPELYDAVRELMPESKPPFRARPFDVQLIGAMVLSGGKIAEMKTGEGKTIVAPLSAYLAAVEHLKVHVVTVNDYLVQRDRDWTYPFFRALGLTVGAIHPMHMQPEPMKRRMYHCDVVYGTTSEFGFDYLRDNMKRSVEDQVQRRREYAVVDEVDSILIDEARTPLIISGPAHETQPRYDLADELARHLVAMQAPWNARDEKVQECMRRVKGLEGDIRNARDKSAIPALQEKLKEAKRDLPPLELERDQHVQYYEVQMDRKQCHLSHDGIAEAQRKAGIGSFYHGDNTDVPHLLEQALRAYVVYERDRDYIVMSVPDQMTGRTDPSIVIVDTNTGRPMIGRQWSDGLHQAVECKEKVPIKDETQTIATITIQNFYKMYKRLSGMTGTADTEAQEFHDIYKLDVVTIPTNKEMIRADWDDLMFLSSNDKWDAIVDEIKIFHDVGRPILVGTTSVEKSELLANMLQRKHGIKHEVLNAKQHEREAHIVENAGHLGAVMIATNMAGRGTDIKLGPIDRETILNHWLRRGICPKTVKVDSSEQELREAVFRKVAPSELGINKREVEGMDFDELELQLLRSWANGHTWVSEKKIDSMGVDELMDELDKGGRFLLHRIRWFENIEDMGGLHVIGTERHESRRIDNQLRGRSGRQGDSGSSRFFVALDDDLMKLFAGETTMKLLSRLGMKEGDAIEHPILSKSVERAQRKVEERNFQVRKNILEYDEVMEHQRQKFYGLRQQALEGRDLKGLVFEYVRDAVDAACDEYLDELYPAWCAADFANRELECSIRPERLRGRDLDQIEERVRLEARTEVRSMISVTLGEYMPDEASEIEIDYDREGLANWAQHRFGVTLDPEQLEQSTGATRRYVEDLLIEAAEQKVEQADLAGLAVYLAPNYGAERLANWAKSTFGIEVRAEHIVEAQQNEQSSPQELLMEKAHKLYNEREIQYPVQAAMDMTMVLMRQSPQEAATWLSQWANRRFDLGWTEESIKTTPPQKIGEQLHEASKSDVESGRLEREINDALACADDDALEAHMQDRFGVELPEWMRFLRDEEREDAIRARVESILRAELVYFEKMLLLTTLDNDWKDHLHSMDQLKDGIGFRAFSQQDPRIAFKKEGAHLFNTMLDDVRDKVASQVLTSRMTPTAAPARPGGGARPPARQAPQRQQQQGGHVVGSSIMGPGMNMQVASPPADQQAPRNEPRKETKEESADPAAQLQAAQAARAADRGKARKR